MNKGDKIRVIAEGSSMFGREGEVLEVIHHVIGIDQVIVELDGSVYTFGVHEVRVIN